MGLIKTHTTGLKIHIKKKLTIQHINMGRWIFHLYAGEDAHRITTTAHKGTPSHDPNCLSNILKIVEDIYWKKKLKHC